MNAVGCKGTAKTGDGRSEVAPKGPRFGPLIQAPEDVRRGPRCPMTQLPLLRESPQDPQRLARCCAEAQADGVPCPTLGRNCEICERAMRESGDDAPAPAIRPVGCD